jgi:hypothetical protein
MFDFGEKATYYTITEGSRNLGVPQMFNIFSVTSYSISLVPSLSLSQTHNY